MELYSGYIGKLIEELEKLPGIGTKSAQRMAFYIINLPEERVKRLSDTMMEAKSKVRYCKDCWTLTDKEVCPICSNAARDKSTIMVVENTRDLAAYEKTGKYGGVYHVLHGAISPMIGIGPADIRLKELITRLEGDVNEVADKYAKHLKEAGFNLLELGWVEHEGSWAAVEACEKNEINGTY